MRPRICPSAPPVDPGSYASLTIRRPAIDVTAEQIEEAMGRLAQSAARFQPVTDRAAGLSGTTSAMTTTSGSLPSPPKYERSERTAITWALAMLPTPTTPTRTRLTDISDTS